MDTFQNKVSLFRNRKKAPPEIQLRFLKQLAKLLNNGYPMIDSLEIIQWDDELENIANNITIQLKLGETLAQALERVHFHHSITSYLSLTELSGDLKEDLNKCIMLYEQRLTYLKKLNDIVRYPLMLASIFTIILLIINQYVLPSFLELFQTNNETATLILSLIKIISLLGKIVIVVGIASILVFIFGRLYLKKVPIQHRIKIYTKLPVYRSFKTLYTSFLFATHLSTLLKSGMTIKQVLHHLTKQQNLPILSHYSALLIDEFTKGRQIDQLFNQLPLIDKKFAIIFQKNINMTELEKDLSVYANMLLDQFHRKMINIITMIQPVFFTLLALFIIFIYGAIMWPMFDLIKTI